MYISDYCGRQQQEMTQKWTNYWHVALTPTAQTTPPWHLCILPRFTAIILLWVYVSPVCCNVLQCVALCCRDIHTCKSSEWWHPMWPSTMCCSVLQCVVVCCDVLQCVGLWCMNTYIHPAGTSTTCCSVLQYVAVWHSVAQCVTVCCSALQCVALHCSVLICVTWIHRHIQIDLPQKKNMRMSVYMIHIHQYIHEYIHVYTHMNICTFTHNNNVDILINTKEP